MALVQKLINTDKYKLKCPYGMKPKGICIHNTANNASAKNEITYMQNNTNSTSFHIAIDDIEAIQGIPFDRNTWHGGDGTSGAGNRNFISIEICYSLSGGERFVKAEQRTAKEVALLLKAYGWGVDKVKKHQDFSGKYCPHRTLDLGWKRFLDMIQEELNSLSEVKKPGATKEIYRVRKSWKDITSQVGAFADLENAKKACKPGFTVYNSKGVIVYSNIPKQEEYVVEEYSRRGSFTCNVEAINFRNKPLVASSNAITGQYLKGENLNYDYVVITNKYYYISWVSEVNKVRRYMPVKDFINKEVWGSLT